VDNSLLLNNLQKKIMREFYNKPNLRISLNKLERKKIWDDFVSNRNIKNISYLEKAIPALYAEMGKAIVQKRNIQPAVFSECVYTQTLAEKFKLSLFQDHIEQPKLEDLTDLQYSEKLNNLNVRYSYSDSTANLILYQAGGANAVDCAFHSKFEKEVTWIEMKEPYARTSEPDLPKYAEDGFIVSSKPFEKNYPQFKSMLEEQLTKKLNVFEHIGNNISEFSSSSIEKAVTENYSGEKFADVICTEDEKGMLVMLPANHVAMWSKLEGEIRPSGRNSYKVWTPLRLIETLSGLDAVVENELVRIPVGNLKTSKARGSSALSRYKINPFFFVRLSHVEISDNVATFPLNAVKQLNPSITAKMNFKGLSVEKVQAFYSDLM
jgi:hypothetical protein